MATRPERFIDTKSTTDIVIKPGSILHIPEAEKAADIKLDEVLQLLSKERKGSKLYDKIWSESEIEFIGKKDILVDPRRPVPDECHIAIIAYTLNDTVIVGTEKLRLYQDFNKKCRDVTQGRSTWNDFPYKSLYCLLLRAIPGVISDPDPRPHPPRDTTLYRGVDFYYSRNEMNPNADNIYSFGHYASFTTDERLAERFAGGKGTVFVWKDPMAAVGIVNYSPYGDEKEVLVLPWSTFKVVGRNDEGQIHKIFLANKGGKWPKLPYTN